MANEINFAFNPGLTLEAAIYANNWVQQGANIALVETGAGTGLYVGSVPGAPAIADGEYQVLFTDTIGPPVDKVVGRGRLNWTGGMEDRRAVQGVTAYTNGVWVDTQGGGAAGTVIGVNGTQANPVDTMADAITIAAAIGITNYKLHGPVTLAQNLPHAIFTAIAGGTTLDPAGFDIGGSILTRIGLTGVVGTASGDLFGFQTSLVGTVTGVRGVFVDPGLAGTIVVGAGTLTIASGASIVPGTSTPIIDLNGVGNLNLRNYSGGIDLRGSTGAGQSTTLEVVAGQVILDASNTAGIIAVRGWPGPFTDNSAGATIDTQGLGSIIMQGAMTSQGYTAVRAILLDFLDVAVTTRATPADVAGLLGNLDVAVSTRASPADVAGLLALLNDITVAQILAAILLSGNTLDAELSGILAMRNFIEGGRDIDFVGNDALGWQRIERDTAGALLRRYNLFDETGSRINETVTSFISRQGMISAEVAI